MIKRFAFEADVLALTFNCERDMGRSPLKNVGTLLSSIGR